MRRKTQRQEEGAGHSCGNGEDGASCTPGRVSADSGRRECVDDQARCVGREMLGVDDVRMSAPNMQHQEHMCSALTDSGWYPLEEVPHLRQVEAEQHVHAKVEEGALLDALHRPCGTPHCMRHLGGLGLITGTTCKACGHACTHP